MFKILVPVQVSLLPDYLLEYTINLCKGSDARLVLFNHLPIISASGDARNSCTNVYMNLLSARKMYLNREAERIIDEHKIDTEFRISPLPLKYAMSEKSQTGEINLIVIGISEFLIRSRPLFSITYRKYLKLAIPTLFVTEGLKYQELNSVAYITDRHALPESQEIETNSVISSNSNKKLEYFFSKRNISLIAIPTHYRRNIPILHYSNI